jgi:hypothetical protein
MNGFVLFIMIFLYLAWMLMTVVASGVVFIVGRRFDSPLAGGLVGSLAGIVFAWIVVYAIAIWAVSTGDTNVPMRDWIESLVAVPVLSIPVWPILFAIGWFASTDRESPRRVTPQFEVSKK